MTLTPPEFSSTDAGSVRNRPAAGNPPTEPNATFNVVDALVGRSLGHFRVEARLASGAMAAVYRATDLLLERQVALKVLLPGADDVVRERFRQEARTVSVLDHPHIVRTLQVGQTDGVTYIAMDLIEGMSLAELLGEQGRLSLLDSCHLLAPVARALDYAHRQHVVHRDVKPSNILLRRLPVDAPQGIAISTAPYPVTPLLSDFGISLALDSPELTAAGRTVGTPTYMAPEQAANSHVIDGRADIYALGIVLYRCLVGRPPYVGSTTQLLHAHVYEPLTIPAEFGERLPPLVWEMLQRMLAKDPVDRYPNAGVLADDLALAAGKEPRKASEEPTATMAALPSPATPPDRLKVLVPSQPNRAGARTRADVATPKPVKEETAAPPRVAAGVAQPRRRRTRGNALGLLVATALALGLMVAGILLLRSVFPVDRFFVRLIAPSPPAITQQQEPADAPAPTGQPAVSTPGPPLTATAPPAIVPRQEPTSLTAATPATPEPLAIVSAPTAPVDVELYWEIVIEDYTKREWNKTLGNLIFILRSLSPDFNQALGQGDESQASAARAHLLASADAPMWAQYRELFDPAQIEAMLFEIYVGMATAKNAIGTPKDALDHFDEALVLRPDEPVILELRDATDRFLAADEAEREMARHALGTAHAVFANRLAADEAFCAAAEQVNAASKLLQDEALLQQLTDYRLRCDEQLEALAGLQLLRELSGAILYSTQEGAAYRLYLQPLAVDSEPKLLVADARQPRVSPDGGRIAFYSTRPDAPGIAGFERNGVLSPDDRTLRYTTGVRDAQDSPPSWSPTGDALVFASMREADGRSRIYVKPATPGDDARSLATGQDPAWAPLDESWVVYNGRPPDGNAPGLWLTRVDELRWHQLTNNERDRRPAWSPDARYVVVMSDGRDENWELYRITLSPELQPLATARLTNRPAQDGLPAISPDGNHVAFVSDQGGRWRIWVAPLNSSAQPLPVADIRGELTSWLEHSIQWIAN
ncbi:MAG: protein kinase [Caldilineaceae bacterium]|nr:protein kinase [Caldilineaceae bacterium]